MGSGFRRSTGLKVKFATISPKLEINTVPATFVDTSTIVVVAPQRDIAHVAHITVTNDGVTYSALPAVTKGGSGTYLEYTYVSLATWGPWALDNHTLSSQGNSMVTVSRKGRIIDGQVEGSIFYAGGQFACAAGPSTRQTFSRFTEVEFLDNSVPTVNSDRSLVVLPSVRDDFDFFVSADFTYELVAMEDVGMLSWRWRKWAAGMYPSGTFSDSISFSAEPVELEYGVTVTFATLTGKQQGDIWRFDALKKSPFIVKGTHISDNTITCHLPPPDPSYPDADPQREGLQQELKVSMRGEKCFSTPTYTHNDSGRTVTGDSKYLANVTEALMFGEDIKVQLEGYFSGPEDYTFELQMVSSTNFKWRKYRRGESTCRTRSDGHWCAFKRTGTISVEHAVHLEHGVFVKFATITGKQTGDRWTFHAYTFWSTTYSPVSFAGTGDTASDDALLYVEGTFIGLDGDATYEVEVMADTGTFRWRKYSSRSSDQTTAWNEDRYISSKPVLIDSGVYIYWLTFVGKHHGDRWKFTAYSGHVVTLLAKSYVGDALPAHNNIDGDARLPSVTGIYLGHEPARLRLEIGGDCTTSCIQFRWIKEYPVIQSPYQPVEWHGGNFTALQEMKSHDQKLTDGIHITWGPTSGYKHGNIYTISVAHMPTSILPVRPTPIPHFSPLGFRSTFHDPMGSAPGRNSVLTVEFTSSTTFKWRKDTGAYSSPKTVIIDEPMTIENGVNLTFSSSSGFIPGLHYLLPLRTHIPHIMNVSSTQNGARLAPTISQPVAAMSNYANSPNQGSLLGDVRPWGNNAGNHSIYAYPAAGMVYGGSSAVLRSGSTHDRGVGLSNVINAVPTQGYLVAKYPTTYIKIIGASSISEISGSLADELTVSGIYTALSSYVYQIEPHSSSILFRWRKYPLGMSDANATGWSSGHTIVVSGATSLDNNLSVAFRSVSYSVSASNRWTFIANRGHTFVHRDVGRALWSDEKVITGQPQQLSSGISVQFSHLSGYTTGDQFVISNRTIDAYGTYAGEKDTKYTVEILNETNHDLPTFHRSPTGLTTGLQAKMNVIGNYTGNSTFVFEIKIVAAGSSELSYFTWRKYLHGYSDGGGPFSAYHQKLSLSPLALDDGLSVSWAAISGQSTGDTWRFTAHAGDTFRWQQHGGDWSPAQRISNIGLVERDMNNVGLITVHVDIRTSGDYEGTTDATMVIEVLIGGSSFRWKKHSYLPLAGAYNATGTPGPYCCGTEEVMYDSNLLNGVGALKDGFGTWSPPINMMATVPILLGDGVHVMFAKTSSYEHGDIYYVPVKYTRHHRMSHGVHLVFGSSSGYSRGDIWSLSATAAVAARGPLSGHTELIIKGSGFLPSSSLCCRLSDPRTLHTMMLPARYVSAEEVHCKTLGHPPDGVADPVFHGSGSSSLFTHGIFTGKQTVVFTIRMVTDTTFQWRVDPFRGANHHRTDDWSIARHVSAGFIHSIKHGLSVRYSSHGRYSVGDEWKVTAYYIDLAQANAHPEIQPGSIRPGVMKYVSVSNDGGSSWSVDQHGLTRFLFSDIYVSTSGDDVTGEGTSALPYRTIQRGIHAALSSPRNVLRNTLSVGLTLSTHLEYLINRDDIIVRPGRYTGAGNTGLFTMGKMIMITAARSGEVVIDCSVHSSSDIYIGDAMQTAEGGGRVNLRGINTENCGVV
eukprot:CAMPEP_0197578958 /NCGR_PEP_ID=MMETSP1326-20131121/3043_1 /TAXON_ID=1155430 /ORGANISM="Genus nov. species nov., Strain RCC2288" /LENGTH=1667 /DNA_ID=CAMNT_0043142265 /DNA_START=375 /DNA_END=5378 /DNA_ORIENTATION=-